MLPPLGREPIAMDEVTVRVELPEETIRHAHLPRIVLYLLPPIHHFGAFDEHLLATGGLINDALFVGLTAARWIDTLAINASVNRDHIARLCLQCRHRD